MFFGDAQSESPRVPSPWISTSKQCSSASARTSPGPWVAAAAAASSSNTSKGYSPTDSPMSRSVRLRNAELSRRGSQEAIDATTIEYDDESRSGSHTSTPLTEAEEDVRIRQDEVEGFFDLDGDLPASHVRSSRNLLRLAPEPDMLGNLEYKLRIMPPTRQRYDKLLTQLKWRLLQGGGECTYEVGLLDDGQCLGICPLEMRASVGVLARMARELNASLQIGKAFFVDDQADDVANQLSPLTAEQVRTMLLDKAIGHKRCSCGASLDSMRDTLLHLQQNNSMHGDRVSSSDHWLTDAIDANVTVDLDGSLHPFTEQIQTRELSPGGDDDVLETTFSLSLDEKATRAGLGFRRKVERKACRYNAQNAISQKHYVANSISAIQTTDNDDDDDDGATQPCLRVLVEVTLRDGVPAESFIDYGSF